MGGGWCQDGILTTQIGERERERESGRFCPFSYPFTPFLSSRTVARPVYDYPLAKVIGGKMECGVWLLASGRDSCMMRIQGGGRMCGCGVVNQGEHQQHFGRNNKKRKKLRKESQGLSYLRVPTYLPNLPNLPMHTSAIPSR